MTDELERLFACEAISALDYHFARALERAAPGQPSAVLLAGALASRAVAQGNVCVDLRTARDRPWLDGDGRPVDVEFPSGMEWVLDLAGSAACGDGSKSTPLVYDSSARLYLARYFYYERDVAAALRDRSGRPDEAVDARTLRTSLDRLCPVAPARDDRLVLDARQRLAALTAALGFLSVISGGPGTGKTTTVLRILAVLIEQALARGDKAPRILLVAPTGKAAARLGEAIAAGRDALATTAEVLAAIPDSAATIHRKLGFQPGSPTRFAHDKDHPLPADIVLVDEASMVDMALMAKLVAAVPRNARLILLGDRDQLASVEAGAILGDICGPLESASYSQALADQIHSIEGSSEILGSASARPQHRGIWDCVVELTTSYRFNARSQIGRLARAIRSGDVPAVADVLDEATDDAQVTLVPLRSRQSLDTLIREQILPQFASDPQRSPRDRLAQLSRFRLLCAHRRGAFGSEQINALIEAMLRGQGLAQAHNGMWDGRPIIVVRNDYQLDLYNGDTGVIAADGGELRAWFPSADGGVRSYLPARLPPHESVYAMTVHKSQGSEFERVAVVVPPEVSPVLTRELIYTAVTRARNTVTVFGDRRALCEAVARRVERASGLSDALWHS